MKIIKLNRGFETMVDDEDYPKLCGFRWTVLSVGKKKYACRGVRIGGKDTMFLMHRVILGVTDPQITVDHRNNNGLDNQRHNIRSCTLGQNLLNKGLTARNTSGYKGLCRTTPNRWKVRIQVGGKYISLGTCSDPKVGARMYDEAARKYHGEFAKLNFPD